MIKKLAVFYVSHALIHLAASKIYFQMLLFKLLKLNISPWFLLQSFCTSLIANLKDLVHLLTFHNDTTVHAFLMKSKITRLTMAFCSGCWYPVGLYCVLCVQSVWMSPKKSSRTFPPWLWYWVSTRISPISIVEKPSASRQPLPARVLYNSYSFPGSVCARLRASQLPSSLEANRCLANRLCTTMPTLLRWCSVSVPPRVIQEAWRRRIFPLITRV